MKAIVDFEKIKKRAEQLKESYSEVEKQQEESTAAYWMDAERDVMKHKDVASVKTTISPTPANMIDGAIRLMTSTEPVFAMDADKDAGGNSNRCENLLKTILLQSNSLKRSPVQVDAARSALLWSDVHIRIKCLKDMVDSKMNISDARRRRLERISKVTPYLIETIQPGYPRFDADMGLVGYLRVRDMTGEVARLEYGGDTWVDDTTYTLWDWIDEEYRVAWIDGESNPLPGWSDKHGLDEIPIAVAVSEGTELFDEEERRRRPFLYKYLAAKLWDRETAVLTTLFTSMHERGVGPLVAIKDTEQEVEVNWAGSVRYITGDVSLLNDKAYDEDILQALDLLNGMAGESLLYRQALGQPLAGTNNAFSTVALMNQAGRLPLVSPSEAVGKAIGDAMSIILRRIGKEGAGEFLKSSDVPKAFTLKATLEVKLPQDQLRNAQVASTLTQGDNPLVSVEWAQQNALGINDPTVITRQIFKERYLGLRFMAMAQEFMAKLQQAQQAPPPQPGQPGQPGPEQMGPEQAMAGAEQLPEQGPMPIPGQEGGMNEPA